MQIATVLKPLFSSRPIKRRSLRPPFSSRGDVSGGREAARPTDPISPIYIRTVLLYTVQYRNFLGRSLSLTAGVIKEEFAT